MIAEISSWIAIGMAAIAFIAALKLVALSPVGERLPGLRQFALFI